MVPKETCLPPSVIPPASMRMQCVSVQRMLRGAMSRWRMRSMVRQRSCGRRDLTRSESETLSVRGSPK